MHHHVIFRLNRPDDIWTFNDVLNLHCGLDLEHSEAIFSQDTSAPNQTQTRKQKHVLKRMITTYTSESRHMKDKHLTRTDTLVIPNSPQNEEEELRTWKQMKNVILLNHCLLNNWSVLQSHAQYSFWSTQTVQKYYRPRMFQFLKTTTTKVNSNNSLSSHPIPMCYHPDITIPVDWA